MKKKWRKSKKDYIILSSGAICILWDTRKWIRRKTDQKSYLDHVSVPMGLRLSMLCFCLCFISISFTLFQLDSLAILNISNFLLICIQMSPSWPNSLPPLVQQGQQLFRAIKMMRGYSQGHWTEGLWLLKRIH